MSETPEFGRVCLSCGSKNASDARHCISCGEELTAGPRATGTTTAGNARLDHVDLANRVELDRFERLDQAELACGLLRANGISCELSNLPLPGLPADIILWVDAGDAKLAWALLADAERESQADDHAA